MYVGCSGQQETSDGSGPSEVGAPLNLLMSS